MQIKEDVETLSGDLLMEAGSLLLVLLAFHTLHRKSMGEKEGEEARRKIGSICAI